MSEEENMGRSVDLMIEQEEIVDCIDKIRDEFRGRGLGWNRFRGDAISRVIAQYIGKHLPPNIKVVREAWVAGCENEFDLLIVNKDADPLGFTSAYSRDQVHLLIEVKGSGVFYKREQVKERLSRKFDEWKTKTGKHVLYISIWEARAHVEEVLRALGRNTAFIFQIEGQDLTYGEWERFLERVTELLRARI